uniref:Uncharacterized protein n=1 Tax=Cacopsylla melanoneura TaxID=428564 RepID=A0A8D8U284_9HEMI
MDIFWKPKISFICKVSPDIFKKVSPVLLKVCKSDTFPSVALNLTLTFNKPTLLENVCLMSGIGKSWVTVFRPTSIILSINMFNSESLGSSSSIEVESESDGASY